MKMKSTIAAVTFKEISNLNLFWILLLAPFFSIAQQTKKITGKKKNVVKAAAPAPVKQLNGFVIEGEMKGFADGTSVALLNGQTGAPESETVIKQNKFSFKGKLDMPDFKIILFNKQPPYLTIFLDNSVVKINGDKNDFNSTRITGSASHGDFELLNAQLSPYQQLFTEGTLHDSASTAGLLLAAENFVKNKPGSFIAPLAAIRAIQVTENPAAAERMYTMMTAEVRATGMSNYLLDLVTKTKFNAVGTVLSDFTQADTTGKPFALSSLRGKYVLIDFWASWCRPCRQENPNVVDNFNKFSNKNFTVLGVSLDKGKPEWIEAIHTDGLAWPHVSDLQGWANAVAKQFQVTSIPQNILIGPDGKIIGKNLRGPALGRQLEKLLR